MNKDSELAGLQETVELYYEIPDLWSILYLCEEEVVPTEVNIVAEQTRTVLLLLNNRMSHILAGTTVSNAVPQESSLLWNHIHYCE